MASQTFYILMALCFAGFIGSLVADRFGWSRRTEFIFLVAGWVFWVLMIGEVLRG